MQKKETDELADSNYWNTRKVEELLYKAEEEGLDFKSSDNPFHDGDPQLKRANILWEYTKEEIQEIERCGKDVVYFAQYCQVMTDDGLMYVKLRDYQESVLREYQGNRFNVFLAPRQVGKCFLPTTNITLKNNKKALIMDIKGAKKTRFFGYIKNFLYKFYHLI